MNRPHIICHMVTSIDGKVTGEFLSRPECEKATEIYYEINRNYKADGFICGRETMQESFAGKEDAPLYKYKNVEVPSGDFIGDKNAKFFAVSFDRHGHIGWESNYIKDEDAGYDNAHIIEVVEGDAVSTLSLAYFRDIGVSYIGADTEGENSEFAHILRFHSCKGFRNLACSEKVIYNVIYTLSNNRSQHTYGHSCCEHKHRFSEKGLVAPVGNKSPAFFPEHQGENN